MEGIGLFFGLAVGFYLGMHISKYDAKPAKRKRALGGVENGDDASRVDAPPVVGLKRQAYATGAKRKPRAFDDVAAYKAEQKELANKEMD